MTRRWRPPGDGWIVTRDWGDLAVWMLPARHAGVAIALYIRDYFDPTRKTWEVWIVTVPRGSWIPGQVMDKPHRIAWVAREPDDPLSGGQVLLHQRVPASHRGHRRLRHNRHVYRWPMPRPIRTALSTPGQPVWEGWFPDRGRYTRARGVEYRRVERRAARRRRRETRKWMTGQEGRTRA